MRARERCKHAGHALWHLFQALAWLSSDDAQGVAWAVAHFSWADDSAGIAVDQ